MTEPRDATAVFSAYAEDYDAPRRRLIPVFDEFYGAAVTALGLTSGRLERILDLGAGTGLLTAAVLEAHPEAEVELLDGSPEMLERARDRLGARAAAMHVADLRDDLPPGPYDAIVSALAIHHLEHADQQRLFAAVWACLRPGGAFINAEQVDGPSPAKTASYDDIWAARAWTAGAHRAETDAARQRFQVDNCAEAETLLKWLQEAGFSEVDCVFRWWRFAVLAAWRAA